MYILNKQINNKYTQYQLFDIQIISVMYALFGCVRVDVKLKSD